MTRLVLTRKTNQAVVVHKDGSVLLTLKITKVDRNQVRLTFEAPKDIIIDREEVLSVPKSGK
jgi:carbon storage regulator CsrA